MGGVYMITTRLLFVGVVSSTKILSIRGEHSNSQILLIKQLIIQPKKQVQCLAFAIMVILSGRTYKLQNLDKLASARARCF